jgi:hypothetical protein
MAKSKGGIETSEIRKKVFSELDPNNNPIIDSWKKFDSKYKLSYS